MSLRLRYPSNYYDSNTKALKFRLLPHDGAPTLQDLALCASCDFMNTIPEVVKHYTAYHYVYRRILKKPKLDDSVARTDGIPNTRFSLSGAAREWLDVNGNTPKNSRQYKCIADNCILNVFQNNDEYASTRTPRRVFEHVEQWHLDTGFCKYKAIDQSPLWQQIKELDDFAAAKIKGGPTYTELIRTRHGRNRASR